MAGAKFCHYFLQNESERTGAEISIYVRFIDLNKVLVHLGDISRLAVKGGFEF